MNGSVLVNKRVLAGNDDVARRIRARLTGAGTLAVNLISSPGSGKTTLLEATVRALQGRLRLGAVIGDIATERDALRLRRLGVPARQILTGGACHLSAALVRDALEDGAFDGLDILFVENVGNLVCPAGYDLGEHFKVALLSVPEGDDKPFKYPGIFARAAVTLVTKCDLLPHVRFDLEAVRAQVATLNADAVFIELSAHGGAGMEAWVRLLDEKLGGLRRDARAG